MVTGHVLRLNDIVKASNCNLYDSKGNKYIDLESGVWCTNVGHSNQRINAVIISQLSKIAHTGFNYCNPAIEEAALKLLEIAEMPNGKSEFICSGSEAIEYCVRVARSLIKQKMIFTFSDSYFGAYGDASKKDSNDWFIYDWQKRCDCNKNGEGCIGECDGFSEIPFHQIGAFLFEPGSSSGLVNFPSQKLIAKISSKIIENQGFVLINEITTGMGRTGKWFGFQHYNLRPDMVAMGKGIGNGYPVSVAAISERVAKQLDNIPFHYSQSHQNDPLGASVVKEVIDVIQSEKLLDRCMLLSEKLFKGLLEIKAENSIIEDIRGRGLMIAIEFTIDASQIQNELLKRGFIVAKRSGKEVLRIDPALTIDEKDIDLFISGFKNIIQEYNNRI